MSLVHLARNALSMPPRAAAAKAARMLGRSLKERLLGRLLRRQVTYPPLGQAGGELGRRILAPVAADADFDRLRALAALWREHRFDLLGSGWVRVAHGEPPPGFEGRRYRPGRRLGRDWREVIVASHWPGNRARAASILALIDDPAYAPIDWQADFKSGWRWSVRTWSTAIAYGHRPGIDVKVPWELARLQHLPPLALAYAQESDEGLVREFRNQVLDFLGSNPPGWGVNWACAMDVAIRAVNVLVARDMFLAAGARLDDGFEDELAAAMLAHGRHVAARLEWHERHRANHYLADICGLAFVAAYLPRSAETDLWLAFAVRELAAEIPRQFGPDGAGFEASTAYHRLSAEMALYTVALVMGLPEDRREGLASYDHTLWRRKPPLAPAPVPWPPFAPVVFERLARAVRFAFDVTKPSGIMVQIGDNDSGRFLKLDDRSLDPRHLASAAAGLFEGLDAPHTPETALVRALAGGERVPLPPCVPAAFSACPPPEGTATTIERLVVVVPDPTALDGLEAVAYPNFGLFVWRGARAFVSVRCGPIGIEGLGAHAHNDQLAVEIEIDGVAWARDPGSYVYTADLALRNAYRSVQAHFAPRLGEAEPARMLGPFAIEDRARAKAWRFGGGEFLGSHQGYGRPVYRRVRIDGGAIVIEDRWDGPETGPNTEVAEKTVRTPAELASAFGLDLAFSPGYGVREQAPSVRPDM